MDCDAYSPNCGVPANRPLTFQFDRWLLPSTAVRQSISVYAAHSTSTSFMLPRYELLTRTVTYWPSGALAPGLVYVLSIENSATHPNGWGFAAYDGRALARATIPDDIVFRTRNVDPVHALPSTPMRFCRDALAAFTEAGCTAANCHRTRDAESSPAGLRLDRASGLKDALGRVARATDRAGTSGKMSVNSERFGMNLPVIAS